MKYKFKIYDSKNTHYCEEVILDYLFSARTYAQAKSKKTGFPVIVQREGNWEKYENGKKTEWSITPLI